MDLKVNVTRYKGLVQHKETGSIIEAKGLYTGKTLKKDFFAYWKATGKYRPLVVDRAGHGELSFDAPLFVEEVNVNE